LEEFVGVRLVMTLSVNKHEIRKEMKLKPTTPQLCLIHRDDILEEFIRVSLAVMITVNKHET